jgi:hypothetical protein
MPGVRARTLALAMCTVALSSTARAENAAAEAEFARGEKLTSDGKVDEACEAYAASAKLEPRAGTLMRLGACREQQGRLASAITAYRDAAARIKDQAKWKAANERAAALEPRLSQLTLDVPAANRRPGMKIELDGVAIDPATWNVATPIDGGEHAIAVTARGHRPWRTTVRVPAENGRIDVEIPRLEPVADPTAGPGLPRRGEKPPTAAAGKSIWTGRRVFGFGLAIVGVGAIGGGAYMGITAKWLEDDAYALCPDPRVPCADAGRANDLIDQAADRALYANIAFGAGGALALGGAILWLTGAPDPEQPPARTTLRPELGPGFTGVALEGRF